MQFGWLGFALIPRLAKEITGGILYERFTGAKAKTAYFAGMP
jgi:hypothetical protein